MNRRHRLHVWLYRRFLRLAPPSHRTRHSDQQTQLFSDLIISGRSPGQLWLNTIPDIVAVNISLTRKDPVSHLTRLALTPLSIVNTLAGITLAVIALTASAIPAWVALPAAAIVLQGAYTLAWMSDKIPVATQAARKMFIAGESTAMLVSFTALTAALVVQRRANDPEYGPTTMLSLVLVHAAIGLLATFNDTRRTPAATTPS